MKKTESADGARRQGTELRRKAEQLLRKKKKAGAAETPAEIDSRALVHELQVHQIELEMQNEELLEARATADVLSIKYMDLFDFAPIGLFLWDEQGKILDLNLAGAILLGLERSTAVKKRFGQFVAVEDRPIFDDFCKKVILAKTKQTCEIKLSIDVKPVDVLIEGIAGLYRKGEGMLCRAAVIDITQRKQVDSLTKLRLVSEAVLAETDLESMLQLIVNAADDLIGAKFIVSGYNYCDGSFTVGPTSLAARDMLNAPEKRIPLGQGMLYIELIVKEGVVCLSEQAIRRYYMWDLPPGHPPLRGLLGAKLTASDGRPEGLIVLSDKTAGGEFTTDDQILLAQLANIACLGLRNIDARRKAEDRAGQLAAANQALEREIVAHVKTEAALRENEIRYRTVADYTYDWEYWTGPDEISLGYVSPACQRISGYSAQEFLTNPSLLESIVHAEDQASRAEHVRQSRDNPNPMRLEYRIITKEGQTRWIEHICQRVYGPDGQSLGHRARNRDITDRKRAEEDLRESESRLSHALDAGGLGIWSLDTKTGKAWRSLRHDQIFGHDALLPEWSYSMFLDHVLPEDRKEVDEKFGHALATNTQWSFECRIKKPDGAIRWIWAQGIPKLNDRNQVVQMVGLVRDITRSKQEEDKLTKLNEELAKLNRIRKALRTSSQAMARTVDEAEYLKEVCKIVVDDCGHAMVWIGYAEDDDYKSVRPVACSGFEEGYLETLNLTWADAERGRGPTGTAIRTGKPSVCKNMQTDPGFEPWRKEAIKRGYASSIVLPLMTEDKAFGAISIYSREPDPFSEDEVNLLRELAEDLSFGITAIRLRFARVKSEEALKQSEERFRTMANSIPQLAWITRADGHIYWYNQRWYDYTGTTPQQMEGWGWQSVHDPAELPRVLERWKTALAEGQPWEDTFPLRRYDGAMRWHLSRAIPIRNDQGQIVRWFGTNTDITERRIMEEELKQAKDAAEAANRTKSRFFANISHDLRTPMNAILGMTELALGEAKEPSIRDYLQTAKESANVLLELLNEVLDLSRMEAGKFQLESAPFNLRATLGHTLKILEMRAHEKGLKLKCAVADDVPDNLAGDPLRLRQVLMNLVGNSVKFTTRGEVNVHIDVLSKSAENLELKFLVQDTGIGISPQDQERIFIPFTQAETSTSRIYGGTGLGLTIASNLVELMGGRIWVESQLGQGSKFHFTVRLGIATAPPSPPDQTACESLFMDHLPAAVKPLRILLAEDNPASQKLVNYILNKRGHHVEFAQNGQEAVEQVERQDLDAVLMDIHMSIMDGFQATAAIRALPDLVKARLPVIAMTASAMKGDQERCLAAGMDAYVSKPMSAKDLISIVERLAAKTQEARTNQVQENRSAAPGNNPNPINPRQPDQDCAANVFNLDEAVKRCFRKYELFQDMVGCLFDESDSLLEQMRAALKSGDAEELGRTAHRLKGTVVFLGAPPAADATMRVEQMGLSGELGNAAKAIDQLQIQIQLLKDALAPHRKTPPRP
jgi:PAS domain S-box-containing protein